jgi:hypothetical protein
MKNEHLQHCEGAARASRARADARAWRCRRVSERAAHAVASLCLSAFVGLQGACSAAGGGTVIDDGGVVPPPISDAGLADDGTAPTLDLDGSPGGGFPDAASPSRSEGVGIDGDFHAASEADRASCYDGEDNNRDGVFDCTDPGCARLPSCCVAGESLACCAAGVPMPLPITSACTGTVEACAASGKLEPFGEPTPQIAMGDFRPLGDAMGDSGALLVERLNPTGAIVVRGTLSTPVGACGEGCFESVGLGLVTDGAPGPLGSVRPWVAVVASAARAELALVIAGETVERVSIAGTPDVDVTLTVLPTGPVRLEALGSGGGGALGTLTARVTPRTAEVQLAIYGRGRNISGTTATSSARGVTVESALCPSPSGWLTRDPLATPATAPASPSAPSVAYGGGQTLLAWEQGGIIQLRELPVDRLSAGITLPTNGPSVSAADAEYGDPDVHTDVTLGGVVEGYTLYVANRTTGTIERVALDRIGMPMGPPIPFAAPGDLGLTDVEALDGPSVLRPVDATSGAAHLFARARLRGGSTRLVRFEMTGADGAATAIPPVDLASATVRVPQAGFAAFDRDEVAAPSAYRHDGGVQLAFAGRSGARWAIGVMSTDLADLSRWHTALATPVLAGDASGFDALSVRDPAVAAQRTDVQMLYVGSDGARDVLGLAARRAPDRRP